MMARLTIFLSLLVLALGHAGAARAETVILAFGDSITQGWNADTNSDEDGGYIPILENLLDTQVEETRIFELGWGGETTDHALARLPAVLLFIGDKILMMHGTNDINEGVSVSTMLFNVEQMIQLCIADEIEPMVSTIIPRVDDPRDWDNSLAREFNAGVLALTQQYGAEFCDNFEAFWTYEPSYRRLFSDHLHPNALGYQVMAETWFRAQARLQPPPAVYSISPTGMVNGLPLAVTIGGERFLPGARPHLGLNPLVDVNVVATGTITATVPAELTPGVYDLVVINPGGVEARLQDAFTITNAPPQIFSISPDTLEAGARARVTLDGRYMESGAQLTAGLFGFEEVGLLGDSVVRALTPEEMPVGVYDIRLTNPDGQWAELSEAFTVVDGRLPEIGNRHPAPGSTGAAPRSTIRLNLRDSGSGVDISSLVVKVNGSQVIPVWNGTPEDFFVEYQPPVAFSNGQAVNVSVVVGDFNQPAPNVLNVLYNFTVTTATDGDGDGLPDQWEDLHSLDPGTPLGEMGAQGDPDRDLLTNLAEYNGGSDPTSPWQLVTGPGPGPGNASLIRIFDTHGVVLGGTEWAAYGAGDWGADVAAGDITGNGRWEVITGPGPGPVYGPQVRGFEAEGVPVPGVNFFAYGTNRYGVRVAAGDIDGDGIDEIVTGAGPGVVFGPHVRGWDADGGGATPIPGVSFFAYGTLKYGVNVSCGDIDGDGVDEIVTGAGPGAIFGPHVRAFSWDGHAVSPVPGVSYFAYGTLKYGVNVACGDVDGDGIDEIVTGAGPGVVFGAHVRGWNVDGGPAAPIPGVSFFAYTTPKYGVNVGCGDLDGDRREEIITAPGPGPAFAAQVRGWSIDHGAVAERPMTDFFAYDIFTYTYGARVAAGHFFY